MTWLKRFVAVRAAMMSESLSTPEIAARLGRDLETVRDWLHWCRAKKIVERSGKGLSCRWRWIGP